MNSKKFEYPNELEKIFDKLNSFNLKVIIVGGYIRDFFLGRKSKDIDIEVFGLSKIDSLIDMLQEFGEVNLVGKSFGVCKLHYKELDLDFSMPRVDNKISNGHRGFQVTTKKELPFTKASSRRDFTINSMGYDTLNKEILDPFGGLQDLYNKILKIVNKKSFIEDPLRVLRAMGMVARFELSVQRDTLRLCHQMVAQNLLDELPKERIYEEFKKLFLKAQRPSLGFYFLKDISATHFFSELVFEDAVLQKALLSLDNFQTNKTRDAQTNIKLLLVLLCYPLDERKTNSFLLKLTNNKKFSDVIVIMQNNLKTIKKKHDTYSLKKLATTSKINELCLLLDAQGFDSKQIYEKAKKVNILHEAEPMLLKGKDLIQLGLKPSKKFSKILTTLYDAQLKGGLKTKKEVIDFYYLSL